MGTSDPKSDPDGFNPPPPSPDPLLGRTLAGRYRLLEVLGRGGMGRVYVAEQVAMQRRVAIKTIRFEGAEGEDERLDTAKRFSLEAHAVSRLQHPNTVRVFDFGAGEDGTLFMAMELLSGRTLAHEIRKLGRLAPQRVMRIGIQVCKSLVEAHAAGIVHRDLKPGNVFLTEVVGETDFVKVLDFGIAKVRDTMPGATVHTQSGTVLGTPMYMAPEQGSAAPVTHAADLYSLGCILYHGLAGRPPFLGDTPLALMVQHAGQPVPSLGSVGAPMDLPAGLEDLVRHLLAKKPGDRPRDAAEVAARLEALGGAVKPSHARESRPGIARRRGLPWWLVAGMAAGVFSGAVASIALIGTSPAPVGSGGAVVDEVDSGDAVADGNTVLDAVPESPGIAIPIPDAGAALDSGPPQGPGVRPPPKLLPACEPSWCRRGLGNECRDPYGRKYRRQDYCLPGES